MSCLFCVVILFVVSGGQCNQKIGLPPLYLFSSKASILTAMPCSGLSVSLSVSFFALCVSSSFAWLCGCKSQSPKGQSANEHYNVVAELDIGTTVECEFLSLFAF